MKKTKLFGALCACATSLSITTPANAAMVLTIDDPTTAGTDVTALDNDNDGVISFNGALGAFTVNVTTGVSKPAISGPQLLDLNSIDVSGGAGNLIISLTDTGYTGSPPALKGLFGGTTIGSVDFDFLYDDANTQFGGTSFFDPAATPSGAFSGSSTSLVSLTAPYSLTIIADLTHDGSGVSSFDAEIQAVPVPAAVWLFGSGLIGLAGLARRKKA